MVKKLKLHRRQIPLFFLLGLVSATWAYAAVDNHQMRRALAVASQNEVEEYSEGYDGILGAETTTVVTASRAFVLFGATTGKVTVFFKTPGPDAVPRYGGIEIGFEQRGNDWFMTDSWGCHANECTERAMAAFGDEA